MKPTHAVLGIALAATAFAANAQPGYVTDGPNSTVVTNPFGLCWKTGDWNASRAVAPCDAVPVAAAPAPAPQAAAPTPPPPVAAAPQRPVIEKVTLNSDVLFDFNKATLKDEGKQKLDELAGRIKDARVDEIDAAGHADRIGSDQYNQKLSEQRAQAVKDYLASSTGLSADKIRAEGKGESDPVTGDQCKRMGPERGSNRKLVQCLQPDRRVEIEVLGSRERSSTGSSSQ